MRSHILINWRNVLFVIIWGAMTAFSGFVFVREREAMLLVTSIICLIFTVGFIIMFPHYIRVTEQNVTIYYAFGQRVSARWEHVREISVVSYRFLDDYKFVPMRGKRNPFQNGSFPKSRRLRKLIEQYWNGVI